MNNEFKMGQGLGHQLEKALARNDWNEALVHQACGGDFLSNVRLVLEGRANIVPLNGEQPLPAADPAEVVILTIDYGRSLEQMITAGRYDGVNSDITSKHFPITGEGKEEVEAKLFHFDRDISSEDAIAEIEKAGWQVAKIEHALACGEVYPEAQRKYPIIALGSVAKVDGDRSVPCLGGYDSRRGLHLRWFDGGWNDYYRFLAVRKKI